MLALWRLGAKGRLDKVAFPVKVLPARISSERDVIIRFIVGAILLLGGSWLLLYSERIQLRLNARHEAMKRTQKASYFRLRITSMNYELPLRFVGALLILFFLVLVIDTGIRLERYR